MNEVEFKLIIGGMSFAIIGLSGYISLLHKWRAKDSEKHAERIEQILIDHNTKTQALLMEMIKTTSESSAVVKNNTEVLNIVKYKL